MLHVLLLILKIILYIILCILGLLLLIVLTVLFAPIRYRVEAEYYDNAKVYAKIRFLIVSIAIRFNQEDKTLDNTVRVAGFRIKNNEDNEPKRSKRYSKKSNKSNKKSRDDDGLKSETDDAINNIVKPSEEESVNIEHNVAEPMHDAILNEEYDLWNNEDKEDKDEDILPEKEKRIFGRIWEFFKGLIDKVRKIYTKLNELKNKPAKIADEIKIRVENAKRKLNRLEKFWNASCTVKTRKYLKRYLVGLLKHIGPRKVKGHVRYGFDEPYKTGKATGYLSLMPFVYHKGFYLEPDFYNKILEGNVLLKGRIRLGYIIRIALNINIWRTIKLARKI